MVNEEIKEVEKESVKESKKDSDVIIHNPFMGRNDGLTFEGHVYAEDKYLVVKEARKVNKLSDNEEDFDLIVELKIQDVVDRSDFINQYTNDVGILNILKKVARSGDTSLFKQCEPGYVDMTKMPEDYFAAKEIVDKANAAYNELPDHVKNGLTAEQFASISMDALLKNISTYVASQTKEADPDNTTKEEVK